MNEFTIRPIDIFDTIRRQRKPIQIAFAASFCFVMLVFLVVPRSYQGEAVLHIGVNYFQNPLIGDLVSQTHDPGELRSERERIVKSSLGVDFAEKMAKKFKLFDTSPDNPMRAIEVEWFLKSLQITDITATQFQIRYRSKNPDIADGVIHGALEAIRGYMYANRVQTLQQFLSVLENEITTSADANAVRSGAPPILGEKSEAAKAQVSSQIQEMQRKLADLQRLYSENHPAIQGLKAQIAEYRAAADGSGFSPGLTRRKIFKSGASSLGMMTIKDDLSKQKHLVNIALEMERKDPSMASYLSLTKEPVYPKKPIFPKLHLFLLFSLVAGVMISTITAAVLEFWQRSAMTPQEFSKTMKVEILGTLNL